MNLERFLKKKADLIITNSIFKIAKVIWFLTLSLRSKSQSNIKIAIKYLILAIISIVLASCRMPDNFGFYQPITMALDVPDGPPEYKAGWHGGCKSALGTRLFANSFVYQKNKGGADLSNGIYQHDPAFQMGWSHGWFACNLHAGTFVSFNSMRHAPLQ